MTLLSAVRKERWRVESKDKTAMTGPFPPVFHYLITKMATLLLALKTLVNFSLSQPYLRVIQGRNSSKHSSGFITWT